MSRIPTPEIDNAPEASKALLEGVKKQLGSVPNMFRLVANSPEVLNGQLAFSAALNGGKLDAATRERIALAVAEINGCNYCLSAHSYIGKAFKLLDQGEIDAARRSQSADARAEAALVLATELVKQRGKVGEAQIAAAKLAGFTDAEILEITAHVAYNTFTNYVNSALDTEIDFPRLDTRAAA